MPDSGRAPYRESSSAKATSWGPFEPVRSWLGETRLLAFHDAIPLIYFSFVFVAVVLTRPSEVRTRLLLETVAGFVAVAGTGALFRTAPEGSARRGASFVYRATLIAVLVHAYLMLRELLPLLRPDAVDAELLAVDRWLFGFEPALWLERFNHTPIVEWFAFFYFSYFFICAAFCFGFVLGRRPDRVTSEFIFGGCFVFFSGPLGYLLVPGVGPGVFQADAFTGPVQGGFFWDCVLAVVGAGGAMKDIFPSLHTALPCFFAAFCWFQWSRSRREDQPRRAWLAGGLVVTFFASNIVVSTMLLRWHYAIDVVAGLLLAATALYIAPRAVALESRSRRKAGLPAFDW